MNARARAAAPAVLLAAAIALGGCMSWLHAPGEHARTLAAEPSAKPLGWSECVDCHTNVADFFAASVHAKNPGCETCHGAGELHVSDGPGHIAGTKKALSAMTARGKSEMCLNCHSGEKMSWSSSHHARGDVACATCHADAVHFKQPAAVKPPADFASGTEFCVQCHAADTAEFDLPFRHPVREETMSCADCHEPHGRARPDAFPGAFPGLLGGESCGRCHADQAGPKVFRHAALDEGCSSCHASHGSTLPAMLKQDGNGLCLQCHFEPGFPVISGMDHTDALASGARCYDCHVELHGSNSDPTLLGRIR